MSCTRRRKKNLKNCNANLALDGWPNYYWLEYCHWNIYYNRSGSIFDENYWHHTSEYSINVLRTEAMKFEKEGGKGVTSVVTDNARNISGMRQHPSEPLLQACNRWARAMNLVPKDASATAKPLTSKGTSILKHLRNHHADFAELKDAKMPGPPLAVDTRWNSVADSLE